MLFDILMTRCLNKFIMQTVRTTIRIRKDLLDQSRMLALKRGTSLQEVINDMLLKGYDNQITDFDVHQEAMRNIDKFRENIRKRRKGKSINTKRLIEQNKKELEKRTLRVLNFK